MSTYNKQTTDSQTSSNSDIDSQDIISQPKSYSCSCEVRCSIEDFVSGRCKNPVSEGCTFPFLNTQGLSKSEQSGLTARLEADFRKIILQYAGLTSSLRQSLRHDHIKPVMLADCLMELETLPPTAKNEEHKLGDHYKEIKNDS